MSTAAPHSSVLGPTATHIPWTLWLGVLAVTSATLGGAWDVSWHRSIGRDSFLTPAHIAIYACGILAGIVCATLILRTTFGHDVALRAASVRVLGLRAPLGAFLAAWGGVAMLTSAPFDNWWHNAYGLDVKIVSPPHTLLILGVRAVSVGILFLILAAMNRAAAAELGPAPVQPASPAPSVTADLATSRPASVTFRTLQALFLYLGGLAVGGQMFFLQEFTSEIRLHQATAYIAMAIAVPVVLATVAAASRFRWAATTVTGIYMTVIVLEILILPLFPAQPKLGPVFYPVTHFVPAKFPILLVAPALALDLLWQRTRRWKTWQVALLSGVVFAAVLVAVEWPFATFLMSHWSQNRFFGTIYFDYNSRPDGPDRLRQFLLPTHGLTLASGLLRASLYAAISTGIGLRFGRWMRSVQR